MKIRKYVLTGGLCCGKTTTLSELANRGFYTTPEIGRIIRRYNIHPSRFIYLALELERLVPQGIDIIFTDRGVVDTLAFVRAYDKEVRDEYYVICRDNRYDGIFVLDMLPDYVNDFWRDQSREVAEKMHRLVIEEYEKQGYDLIYVPVMDVTKRADFILKKVL